VGDGTGGRGPHQTLRKKEREKERRKKKEILTVADQLILSLKQRIEHYEEIYKWFTYLRNWMI